MARSAGGQHRRMFTGRSIRSLFNKRDAINKYRQSHHHCGMWGQMTFPQVAERVGGAPILWIHPAPLWVAEGPDRPGVQCQQTDFRLTGHIHRVIRRLWVHDRYLGL